MPVPWQRAEKEISKAGNGKAPRARLPAVPVELEAESEMGGERNLVVGWTARGTSELYR